MKISKGMKVKIMLLKDRRESADRIEKEIFDYFESQGIDTTDEGFTDVVGAKISYGEFNSVDDVETYINEFLGGRTK